jgi:hypothetical protein
MLFIDDVRNLIMICSRCGFPDNDILPGFSCSSCGTVYSSEPKTHLYTHQVPLWETTDVKEVPFTSFIKTVKEIFIKPDQFFKQISSKNQKLQALLFALLCGSIGYTFLFLWSQLFPEQLSEMYESTESFFTDKESSSAATLLFTPILIALEIIFIALYTHTMLCITRTSKNSFSSTLKIVSYAQCALLLNIIPVIGSFFSAVYMFFLLLTGIKYKHEIGKFKAFLVIFLPIIIISLSVLIVLFVLVVFGVVTSGLIEKSAPFLHQ